MPKTLSLSAEARQSTDACTPQTVFAGQAWLLINRLIRGYPCNPASLRSLAGLCEELARAEEAWLDEAVRFQGYSERTA
jgi:hypothetical protein